MPIIGDKNPLDYNTTGIAGNWNDSIRIPTSWDCEVIPLNGFGAAKFGEVCLPAEALAKAWRIAI